MSEEVDRLTQIGMPIGIRCRIEAIATQAIRESQIMLDFRDDAVDVVMAGNLRGYPAIDAAYTAIQGLRQQHEDTV